MKAVTQYYPSPRDDGSKPQGMTLSPLPVTMESEAFQLQQIQVAWENTDVSGYLLSCDGESTK